MKTKNVENLGLTHALYEHDHQVRVNAIDLIAGIQGPPILNSGYQLDTLFHLDRPFSRLVKVKVTKGEIEKNYFIKQFRYNPSPNGFEKIKERVLREFNTLFYYHDKFKGEKQFKLPRPVTYIPEELILITEEIQGEMISDMLERSAYFFPSKRTLHLLSNQCRLVGEWLTRFQWKSQDDGNGKFKLDEMAQYIDVRLARLEGISHVNFNREERLTLLEGIHSLIDQVPESDLETCGIHADFCPGNCIMTTGGVGVVDFAMYQPGSVYHDVTHFYHRMTILRHKPIYRRETIRHLNKIFIEGYAGKARFDSPLFVLFLIQHLVCHFDMMAQQKTSRWLTHIYNQKILSSYAKQLKMWCQKIPQDPSRLFFYA